MKTFLTLSLVTVFWYSNNPSIISIDPQTGVFKSIYPGKTEICAVYGSVSQCIPVTIPAKF